MFTGKFQSKYSQKLFPYIMSWSLSKSVASTMKNIPIRFILVTLLMLVTSFFYAGRSILSISGNQVMDSIHVSTIELGYLFSAFSVTYVLFQIPCGLLLDKWNTRKMYLFFLIGWSAISILTFFISQSSNFTLIFSLLFTFRLLAGFFEAPIFPANSRIVSKWFPRDEISFASSIFGSSQYFSIFIFSPIIAWVTFHQGWEFTFLYLGIATLILGIVLKYWLYFPKVHPYISTEETRYLNKHLLNESSKNTEINASTFQKIFFLLTNRTMVGVCLGQYSMTAIIFFFLTWFPLYLMEVKNLSLVKVGFLASIPALFGFIGNLLGGLTSDKLIRKGRSLSTARKIPIIIGMLLSFTMIFSPLFSSEYAIIALMSLAFFGKGFSSIGWTIIADVAPQELYGLCGGIFNTFGNVSGIISPIAIAYLISLTGSFDVALYFTALHALLAMVCFIWIVGSLNKIKTPDEWVKQKGPQL